MQILYLRGASRINHPLHRRVAPRICSLARFSRPVPGVKKGSAATPSLLTSTSAPPSSSAYDSRHVAGAHSSGSAQKHLQEQPAICTVPVAFHAVVLVAALTAQSSASLRLCSGTTTSTARRTAPPQVPRRYLQTEPLNRRSQWPRAPTLWSMMSASKRTKDRQGKHCGRGKSRRCDCESGCASSQSHPCDILVPAGRATSTKEAHSGFNASPHGPQHSFSFF